MSTKCPFQPITVCPKDKGPCGMYCPSGKDSVPMAESQAETTPSATNDADVALRRGPRGVGF